MRYFAVCLLLSLITALLLAGCNLVPERSPTLPIRLEEFLPEGWQPVGEPSTINVDGDPQQEWLLFFRYDRGPIGAVVYDAQSKASSYDVSEALPAQPTAFLIPYALLPNTEDERGLGYIGDDRAAFKEVDNDEDGQADVLLLLGYWNGVSTRLTMAWWEGESDGYGIAHLVGDGGIRFDPPDFWQKEGVPLKAVFTRHRLNDRSGFCEEQRYRIDWEQHRFIPEYSQLVFCRAIPPDPVYPEGTVLSFLLRQTEASDQGAPPVFNQLMTPKGRASWQKLFRVRAFVQRKTMRVLEIRYLGILGDEVNVWTVHQDDFGRHRLVWRLIRQRPTSVTQTVTWRIDGVGLEADEDPQ